MIMAGRGRRLENTSDEPSKVGTSQISSVNTVDLPCLINKIIEINTNDINVSLLMNIQNMFKQLFTSKEAMKDVLSNLHNKALTDSEFGEKLVLSLEQITHLEVDGTLLRGELLSFIQSDFEAKDTMVESDPQKLVNSVLLLGNIYHRFKVCGAPIAILGIALLEYFDVLIKGDERQLKILTKQVLINGTKLSQVKNYEVLKQNLRSALVTKNLNYLSKCWILLTIDFMSNDFKPLKGTVRDFYVQNLGEEYTKLESLLPIQSEQIGQIAVSPDSMKSQDSNSTTSRNKNFNCSPNKIDSFKKDLTRKFSDMSVKSGSGKKDKSQSPPGKNNKKEIWKSTGGGRGGSGHDDRFEKDENFYGAQKPRQLKPLNQKKRFSDDKISKKENDDFKTDFNKSEPQQEIAK